MKISAVPVSGPAPVQLPAAYHETEARIAKLDALIATIPADDYAMQQQAGDKLWQLLTSLQKIINQASGPVLCPVCEGKKAIKPSQLGRPNEPRVCTHHDLKTIRLRHTVNGSTG